MSPESADISGSPTESGAREDIEKISFNDSNAAVALDCEDVDRSAVERRLVRRIDMRILPISMITYLLSFIDRSNIGNAKILNADKGHSLIQSTHITNAEYLTALVLFVIAYGFFETPSNYALKHFRPSRWFTFLPFGWGVVTMTLGAARNFSDLVVIRFFLGAFEAGIFPGLVFLTTFWYTPRERAVRIALILACATLAGAFGGAIAYGVGFMDGVGGLEAWRWLFILEGIPTCVFSFVNLFFLPDYPETASWLSGSERDLAIARLKGDRSLGHTRLTWNETRAALIDWRLYLHYLIYVAASVSLSSLALFTPSIVAGLGYEGLDAQLWTVPPYAIAFVVVVATAWVADHYELRCMAGGVSMAIAGIAFTVEGALAPTAYRLRYGFLVVSVSFSFASIPPLLSWLTANLRTTAASTLAIPLNISAGQLGQIIGVYIYKADEAPGYPTGHFTNAGCMFVGVVVLAILRYVYERRNKRLLPGERLWRL